MSTITLRLVKGAPLTNQEVDDNFANLNNDKYEAGDSASLQDLTLSGMSGPIAWNVDDGALDIPLNADVTLQTGQEFVFYAKATEAISNGDVVMFAGAQGGHLLVAKANMSAAGFDPTWIVGVATQDFAINEFGYTTALGKVRGLDTSALSEGGILYVDPTTTGAYTTTKPSSPNHIIQIAAVVRSHGTQGAIQVRVTHIADTDEVPEGATNLYFTNARAVAAIKADADWNATNWDTAYSWGDHAGLYLPIDAVTLPDQTGHAGQFLTTNGTTADWATVDTSLGDTAYGWGDHALVGYLTSETDPTVPSHVKSITTTNISNWNTAYGWGNHASQGYATQTYVNNAVSNLVDSAPATLDTLNELAAALGDDPNFATTVTNSIGTKWTQDNTKISNWDIAYTYSQVGHLPLSGGVLTGSLSVNGGADINIGATAGGDMGDIVWRLADGTEKHRLWDGGSSLYYRSNGSGANRVFHDAYHPNADKWTTARTLSLSGDASGSVSWDGSANATLSVTVNNDSHEHTYIKAGGDGPSTEDLNSVANAVGVGRLSYRGFNSSSTNRPPASDNANGVITVGQHNGNYSAQLAFSSDGKMYHRDNPAGVHGAWQGVFTDAYHPNADKWTTARTITLSGDLTGSVDIDGSSNVTLSAQVVNDSHTHDGRYVNVTGDTMTGALTMGHNSIYGDLTTNYLNLGTSPTLATVRSLWIRADDDDSSNTEFLHLSAGQNTLKITSTSGGGTDSQKLTYNGNKVFHEGYHPNADKWTTARNNNINLTGDVTGYGSASVDGTGNWTVTVNTTVRQPAVGNWFNNGHPLVGTDGVMEIGRYIDFHNSDTTTSDYTARITNTGNALYASGQLYADGNQRVFADNYHPNADKWTTARTITLGGDLTGSVSLDGSSNVTLSAQVVNDSHTHDGRYYTESEIQTFMNRGYISGHGASNLAVGWYTIATNSGDRASARFGIWDGNSGDHQSVTFYASHHFGTDSSNTITVLDNSYYSGNPFRYIRIKDAGTYDGAALQIYIDDASNSVSCAILGDNFQSSGWVLCDWIPDATTPPNVSNYANFGERSKVDLNQIAQGGFATTGEIYAGGDTTLQRVFHDAYHPNADKWTTARTITLSGDLTGSVSLDGSSNVTLSAQVVDDSHNHVWGNIDGASVNAWGGLRHSTASGYIDFGPANTTWAHIYTDRPAFYFNKELYVNNQRVFNDAYHPNADKWTTARTHTVTLTGDVTGTASQSVDGTGNRTWTISTVVGNDSHSHSNYVVANTTSNANIDSDWGQSFKTFDPIPSGTPPISNPNIRTINVGENYARRTQLAFVYNQDRAWFRRRHDSTWYGWNEFWHTGNDGSGSGLDADLLDGIDSTRFTKLTSQIGSGDFNTIFSTDTQFRTQISQVANITNGNYSNHPTGVYTYGSVLNWRVENSTFQLYTSHTGDLVFRTGWNNDGYSGWRRILNTSYYGDAWRASNDGSGSGLDADLLDGQHASAFASASHSHPYLPLSGGTLTGHMYLNDSGDAVVQKLSSTSNYGAAIKWYKGGTSQATYDPQIGHHNTGGDSTGSITILPYATSTNPWGGTVGLYIANNSFKYKNNTVWHAGNDGSGSGLDADLLDGQQGSYYTGTYTAAHVGLDTSGSTSYPRMFARNNPTSSPDWLRVSSNGGGLLPYSNGNSYLGTSSWRFGQIHGVNIYENGTALSSKYAPISHSHSYLPLSGGDMTGRIYMASSASHPGNAAPTALAYGKLTGYGTFYINADTDGSTTEYLYLTAGYGQGAGASNEGLRIGYAANSLTWKGNAVWNAGNDGSGSGLDADLIDGIDSSRIVYGGGASKINSQSNANSQVNSGFYENGGGGTNWPSGTWYNSINVRHSNQGNYHGFQLAMSYYDNHLWARSYQGSGTFQGWAKQWSTYNDGSGSGLDADLLDGQHASAFASASHSHSNYVTTTYNTSLNSDSRNSRGVTRLYRRDDNSDFSVQNHWTGSHWHLRGYNGDNFHAECRVGYADSSGNADTLDGQHASAFVTNSGLASGIVGISNGGAVGSYIIAMEMGNDRTARNLGATVAGSSLRPASILMSNSPAVSTTTIYRANIYAPGSDDNAVLSGTWRLMSAYADSYTYNDYPMALWLRIS